jgi:hypothetical protein
MEGDDESLKWALKHPSSDANKLTVPTSGKIPGLDALPAWQQLLARVRKFTRFNEDSLELVEHEAIEGHADCKQLLTVSLKSEQERVHGRLPTHVGGVDSNLHLNAALEAQLAACKSGVAQILEKWRRDVPEPAAIPASSLFLTQAKPIGYTLRCNNCAGGGKLDCSSCHKRGKVTCSRCGGRGNQSCLTCSSRGRVRCSYCGGTGLQVNNGSSDQRCNTCNGSGEIMCWDCAGTRNVTCQTCGGQREVTCHPCSGSGEIICASCSGTGFHSVIGHIRCSISASDSLNFECSDKHLIALLGNFSTIREAVQHMSLAVTSYDVGTETLTTRIEGKFIADRFGIKIGSDNVDLHAMRHSGAILDYRNIVGRLLQSDIDALKAARSASKRFTLLPSTEVVDALGAVLESEAVSLILQGKSLAGGDANLVSADFAKEVRDQVGRTLQRVHWHLAAPLMVPAILLPFTGYDLAWRLPFDKHLNYIALLIFVIPLALCLVAEWGLRRQTFSRMGPVATAALQRLVRQTGYVRNTRIAVTIATFVGMLLAMRMWIF